MSNPPIIPTSPIIRNSRLPTVLLIKMIQKGKLHMPNTNFRRRNLIQDVVIHLRHRNSI